MMMHVISGRQQLRAGKMKRVRVRKLREAGGGGGSLPQTEVVQEARRGKTSMAQAAQPLPGSSCPEARTSLGPRGPHCIGA